MLLETFTGFESTVCFRVILCSARKVVDHRTVQYSTNEFKHEIKFFRNVSFDKERDLFLIFNQLKMSVTKRDTKLVRTVSLS